MMLRHHPTTRGNITGYGSQPKFILRGRSMAGMEGICFIDSICTTAKGEPQFRGFQGTFTNVCSHWRSMRTPLVWDCRKPHRTRIAWSIVYRLIHTPNITKWTKPSPLTFNACGDYSNEEVY